jgi:hypothetical protein
VISFVGTGEPVYSSTKNHPNFPLAINGFLRIPNIATHEMSVTQKIPPHASVGVGLLVGREGLEPSTR